MKCVLCPIPIDPVKDEFEEVGSIEFAHVSCKDRAEGIEEAPRGDDMAYLLGNSAS